MVDALRDEVALAVAAVRDRAPLIHGITGSATQALVADGLLAAGARPMLTATRDEAPALVTVADALLVNLGSLSTDARDAILPTVEVAAAHGIPWVLDPAAVGVAPLRTPLARALLSWGPSAVRGNASEVLTVAGRAEAAHVARGPDSTAGPDDAADAAREVAAAHGCVVAVSGPVDLVTDGSRVVRIASGHPMLTRVGGTGCLLGALTAAHLAVADPVVESLGVPEASSDVVSAVVGTRVGAGISTFGAVVAATALLTCASERAGLAGPGTFRVTLLDAIDAVSADEVAASVDLRWG